MAETNDTGTNAAERARRRRTWLAVTEPARAAELRREDLTPEDGA